MIHFQLTEKEVVLGLMKYRPKRRRIVAGGLLVLLGILELILGGRTRASTGEFYTAVGYVFIGFGIIFTLLAPWIFRRAYLKVVRANPSFTAPKDVSFDENGLISSSPIQRLEVTWAYYKKLTQDERYFYLHIDQLGNVSILPKSAFDDDGREAFLKCSRSVPRA